MYSQVKFSELEGKTLSNVDVRDDRINFVCSDGLVLHMYHNQDCCESVTVEDVCGCIEHLIGSPIVLAEEVSNEPDPGPMSEWHDSYTWTFYKIATTKGAVTIRWYGTSNGYYSEGVDLCWLQD